MSEYVILVEGSDKQPSRKKSQAETWDFGQVNVGASKLSVKETSGSLDLSGQQLIVNAVPAGDSNAATKKMVDDEASARTTAINTAIGQEVLDRDGAISTAIGQEVLDRDGAIGAAIGQEVIDRNSAISSAVGQEVIDRNSAISSAIGQEVIDRNAAISSAVGGEAGIRAGADSAMADDISGLQGSLASILGNNPAFESKTSTSDGQTDFTFDTLTFDGDNGVYDIVILIDGRWNLPATHFTKLSTSSVRLVTGIPIGKLVTVWKQGTAVVSSGGGGTDLTNIVVDMSPAVNGAKSVGTLAKAFKSLIIKDTDNSDVWEIKISSGVLIPTKLN